MIGQKRLKSVFTNLIKENNIPKLNILVGVRGFGKKEFLKWISQEFNIPYKLITPKGSSLSVEEIREAKEEALNIFTPTLYVFEKLEMNVHLNGQNALLKFLEEPPENISSFLLVENLDFLLPTIVSRGIIYTMDAYTKEELKEFNTDELALEITNVPGELIELSNNNTTIQELIEDANKVILKLDKATVSNAFHINSYIKNSKGEGKYNRNIFIKALNSCCLKLYKQTQDLSIYKKYKLLNQVLEETGGSVYFIDSFIIRNLMEKA